MISKFFQKIANWYFTKGALPYWCVLLLDCLAVYQYAYLTYFFNFDGAELAAHWGQIFGLWTVYLLPLIAAFRFFHTYSGILRYSSFVDLHRLASARIMSSVGLPANAIRTPYAEKLLREEKLTPKSCSSCLKHCSRKFCVNNSLVAGHSGDYENGLFFAGKDAWKINDIVSVHEIFERFKPVFEKNENLKHSA